MVLARLSAGYSILRGRLPMYSSPVRHFTTRLPRILVRLACVRRAASVRSEPGSNSQKNYFLQGPPLQHTLRTVLAVIQMSKNFRSKAKLKYIQPSDYCQEKNDEEKSLITYLQILRREILEYTVTGESCKSKV
jgi:hypothetical protein